MKETRLEEFGQYVSEEILALIIGKEIAVGAFRRVYQHNTDPTKVVKVEMGAEHFHNVAEYQFWVKAQGTRWEKWLCPVLSISFSGSVIIMPKVEALKKAPARVPGFLNDLKLENWGLLNGKPVCVDYGYNNAVNLSLSLGKLIKWEDGAKA